MLSLEACFFATWTKIPVSRQKKTLGGMFFKKNMGKRGARGGRKVSPPVRKLSQRLPRSRKTRPSATLSWSSSRRWRRTPRTSRRTGPWGRSPWRPRAPPPGPGSSRGRPRRHRPQRSCQLPWRWKRGGVKNHEKQCFNIIWSLICWEHFAM